MSEVEKSRLHDDDAAVEAKRANLLSAKGDLAVGRREEPTEVPQEAQERKKRAIVGTALCAAVLVAVLVLLKVFAADISL